MDKETLQAFIDTNYPGYHQALEIMIQKRGRWRRRYQALSGIESPSGERISVGYREAENRWERIDWNRKGKQDA